MCIAFETVFKSVGLAVTKSEMLPEDTEVCVEITNAPQPRSFAASESLTVIPSKCGGVFPSLEVNNRPRDKYFTAPPAFSVARLPSVAQHQSPAYFRLRAKLVKKEF